MRDPDRVLLRALAAAAFEEAGRRHAPVPPWFTAMAQMAAAGDLDARVAALHRRTLAGGRPVVDPDDPRAAEAVQVFFEILGQIAGDLVLTIGGFDGAHIAGGIAKRYPDTLSDGTFRSAFKAKGRHRHIVERIPTYLITHEQPGLLGASYCVLEVSDA